MVIVKWFITTMIVSPHKDRVVGPIPNGIYKFRNKEHV